MSYIYDISRLRVKTVRHRWSSYTDFCTDIRVPTELCLPSLRILDREIQCVVLATLAGVVVDTHFH